jgi:hypothetical protein
MCILAAKQQDVKSLTMLVKAGANIHAEDIVRRDRFSPNCCTKIYDFLTTVWEVGCNARGDIRRL